MFAIQNIKTGKFLYGTDYRYLPPHQRTSRNQALTYDSLATAKADFRRRRCGKDYRVVCLKTIEVKRIIEFDTENCYEIYNEDWRTSTGLKSYLTCSMALSCLGLVTGKCEWECCWRS